MIERSDLPEDFGEVPVVDAILAIGIVIVNIVPVWVWPCLGAWFLIGVVVHVCENKRRP